MSKRSHYTPGQLLGVHVVSEHIFCPRAMLTTHADSYEDVGEERSILRLDYAPCYELSELERKLDSRATLLWQLIALVATFATVGFLLSMFFHWSFLWAGLLAAVIPARFFLKEIRTTLRLLRDHRSVGQAKPIEPSELVPHDEAVNWWSLRAAGFVSHPVDELLVDDELTLKGRPWRILRRGPLAIPVFVRSGTNELRPQQRVRIAAYCHLIRVNERAESPFGIVLDRGTFEGIAVKPSEPDLQRLKRALRQIPRVLTDWLSIGSIPKPPMESNYAPCWGCPHGKPRLYEPEVTETTCYDRKVTMYRTKTELRKDQVFHSPCGDHFGWIPPHELAEELQLRPASSR